MRLGQDLWYASRVTINCQNCDSSLDPETGKCPWCSQDEPQDTPPSEDME